MKQRNVLTLSLVGAMATLSLLGASCSQPKGNTNTALATTSASGEAVNLPYAYVRLDTVMSVYKYALEVQEKLAADAKASETRLKGRAAALQQAAENFERKAKINAFVSQEQAQAEQNKVLKLQQEVANLQQELAGQLAQKQALMQEDLMKEVEAQLKVFNAGRFKMILSNVSVLYADESLDLTKDFIEHLNANYKSAETATTSQDSTKTN